MNLRKHRKNTGFLTERAIKRIFLKAKYEMDKLTKKYNTLLTDIKSILQKGLGKAYKAVDNVKVQTYWQMGERIVSEELSQKTRADYGKRLIDSLAVDLGFKRRELYLIVQFYKTYQIVQTLSAQLSWSHYRT